MNQRRWTWIGATVAAFALLLALVELPRTPLPWYDEILLVSAARSATLGHPAMPSVLDAFPQTMGLPLFPLLLLRKRMKLSRDSGSAGFDSRGPIMNFALSLLARCEPLPQKFIGTSVMAAVENQP